MPCDTRRQPQQTAEEREAEIVASLRTLESRMQTYGVTVKIGPNGALAFAGWKDKDRNGVSDVCAYRRLSHQCSFALRVAIARAEMQSGRKVNEQAVAAGVHSHDGGETWGHE